MKPIASLLMLATVALMSCKKTPMDVTSTEKRGLTTKDGDVKLFASPDEQFRGSSASSLLDAPPSDWLQRPASQFRLLNYAFGASGKGEVYVSKSQGSVLDNVNRWRKQFAQQDLTASELADLPKVTMLGADALMVEAQGLYAGGMGKPPVEGFALAGLVAKIGDDIITIKMVGPSNEVEGEKAKLIEYAKSLKTP
ncbi:MAG: hypothetical protein RI957_1617 [Verrucomicrobiota bacterium]|jgi:hypothetical protein